MKKVKAKVMRLMGGNDIELVWALVCWHAKFGTINGGFKVNVVNMLKLLFFVPSSARSVSNMFEDKLPLRTLYIVLPTDTSK